MAMFLAMDASTIFPALAPWLLLLFGAVVVGGVVLMLIRRSMRRETPGPAEGFSLQGLREMHESGQLSDAEFEQARAALIGRVKASASTRSPAKPSRDDADS
jgi:hypothetical protein